jgi:hypothetical protein
VALKETTIYFILRYRQQRGTYSVNCWDDSSIMTRRKYVEERGRGQPAVGHTVPVIARGTEENIEKHGDSRLLGCQRSTDSQQAS